MFGALTDFFLLSLVYTSLHFQTALLDAVGQKKPRG